jgi:hypothetical protein
MARVEIEPLPMELGLHREQYEALVRELEQSGYDVELIPPEELRSGGSSLAVEVADVTLRVIGAFGGLKAAVEIASMARRHLRSPHDTRTRLGLIHLPDGSDHEFDIPSETT